MTQEKAYSTYSKDVMAEVNEIKNKITTSINMRYTRGNLYIQEGHLSTWDTKVSKHESNLKYLISTLEG